MTGVHALPTLDVIDGLGAVYDTHLVDLDGDGPDEYLVVEHDPPRLRAFDGTTELWSFSATNGAFRGVSLAQLDGDPAEEVYIYGLDGKLYALDDDGSVIDAIVTPGLFTGATADLDGDGRDDYVAAGINRAWAVTFDGGLTLAWVTTTTFGPGFEIIATDLTSDGLDEVLVGGRVQTALLSTTGELRWAYASGSEGVAVDDFTGDDVRDIALDRAGRVTIVDVQGDELWSVSRGGAGQRELIGLDGLLVRSTGVGIAVHDETGAELFRSGGALPVSMETGDVDGDGVAELVWSDRNGLVTVMARDGTVLATEEFSSGVGNAADLVGRGRQLAVRDTDGDGFAEVAVGSGTELRVFGVEGQLQRTEKPF